MDTEVTIQVDEARARLKRQDVHVSLSMFIEIALRELLARKDLADVLRRHKAKLRRD
ncbi:MAG: hypothetical protein HKL91_09645 [Candidatus Eremiobacteraeota bacterium]|nr:hypothetical protein [Candidatus Eremiobacteraeota bacterium]